MGYAPANDMRTGNDRAKELDPTLGGWNNTEACGPDGLVPNGAARRHYAGEDL